MMKGTLLMDSGRTLRADARTVEENGVRTLYQDILERWNRRNAHDFAALFVGDGNVIGFDGSQMNGQPEIESVLGQIFIDHVTATFLGIIREVRFLSADVAVLRAVVGMSPPGTNDINPAVNAIQTLVATKQQGQWRAALFQNTPAALHGRPQMRDELTVELRLALRGSPSRKSM